MTTELDTLPKATEAPAGRTDPLLVAVTVAFAVATFFSLYWFGVLAPIPIIIAGILVVIRAFARPTPIAVFSSCLALGSVPALVMAGRLADMVDTVTWLPIILVAALGVAVALLWANQFSEERKAMADAGPDASASLTTNKVSVWALATAGLGLPGIVLGAIGRYQVNRFGQRGKGLAIGGFTGGCLAIIIPVATFFIVLEAIGNLSRGV